jgi:hypothetical protein
VERDEGPSQEEGVSGETGLRGGLMGGSLTGSE